jgi:hypothetical protein
MSSLGLALAIVTLRWERLSHTTSPSHHDHEVVEHAAHRSETVNAGHSH